MSGPARSSGTAESAGGGEGFVPVTADRGDTLVSISDLRTYYDDGGVLPSTPVKAVDGVSLDLARGETVGLVGESGCGKTTLGRTLAGFETPTAGTITFDGRDVTHMDGATRDRWRRHCQMVFQDPDSSLDERMTVGEIVAEPLAVHDWADADARRERAFALLERVGLQPDHYYRYPHQFSGGQRQRVAIARALALEPEFLVLDEPVSALDVSVQARILDLLADLQAAFELTYLFIAHDLAVVRQICDRVAVMYLGQLMEVGPTESVFEAPEHPYTRSLLSAIPEPDPTADWDPTPLHGTPPDPKRPPAGCPFTTRCPHKIRPDGFDLDADGWRALDVFYDVLRTRARRADSLSGRVRRLLGRTADRELAAVRDEVFADHQVHDAVATELDAVVEVDRRDGPAAALERFVSAFGSACDTDPPGQYERERGGRSRCHRNDEAYPSLDDWSPVGE